MATSERTGRSERSTADRLRHLEGGDKVVFVAGSNRVEGIVTRVEKGREEVRVEVAPFDAAAPQYQLRTVRRADGWREITAHWTSKETHPTWRTCCRPDRIDIDPED